MRLNCLRNLVIMQTHNWRASLKKIVDSKFYAFSFSSSVIGYIFDCVCEVQLRLCESCSKILGIINITIEVAISKVRLCQGIF